MRELFASLRAIMPAWAGAELTVFAVLIILLVFWSTYQLIPENPHAWECIHHQHHHHHHPRLLIELWLLCLFFFLGGYVIELSGRQFETGPETEQKMLISWKPLDKQGRDRGVSYWEAVGPAGWLDGSVMGAPSHQVKATVTVSAFLSSSTGHLSISQTEALERKCSFSCFPQVGGQGKLLLR